MRNVLKRKIFISKDRGMVLKQLYEDVTKSVPPALEDSPADDRLETEGTQPGQIRVLLFGFDQDDPRVHLFRENLGDGYVVKAVKLIERDWVRMMKTARPTYTVDEEPVSNVPSSALENDSSSIVPPADESEEAAATPEASKKKKESKKEKKKRQPQVSLTCTAILLKLVTCQLAGLRRDTCMWSRCNINQSMHGIYLIV
jgi:hypothetical protein